MNSTPWTDQNTPIEEHEIRQWCESLLAEYQRTLTELTMAISQQTVTAYAAIDSSNILHGQDAAAFIIDTLQTMTFDNTTKTTDTIDIPAPSPCMAIGVTHNTLLTIQALNTTKQQFKQLHSRYIKERKAVKQQGHYQWRKVLKDIQQPRLDVKTVDRLIPVCSFTPDTIRWHTHRNISSERSTLQAAINELQERKHRVSDDLADYYDQAIASLQTLPSNTPLSRQLRQSRSNQLLAQASAFEHDNIPPIYSTHPVCFLAGNTQPNYHPTHTSLSGQREEPKEPIHPLLQNWFHIRPTTTPIARKKRSSTCRTHVKGIWMSRKPYGVVFSYKNLDGKLRTQNMSKPDIKTAWANALRDKGLEATIPPPSPDTINAFVESTVQD